MEVLERSGLGAENIARLRRAYQVALRALHLMDRNDPIAEMVAKKIIAIGKDGGEPDEIAQRAVKAFGIV